MRHTSRTSETGFVHGFVHETLREGIETEEREQAGHEHAPSIRRDQRTGERPPGTAETGVVWLITQRSEVQILPPLPRGLHVFVGTLFTFGPW